MGKQLLSHLLNPVGQSIGNHFLFNSGLIYCIKAHDLLFQASDSSSTSSSLEFVQLEENGAQYKRRSSKGGHGPGPDPTPGPAAPESAAAVEADPGDTERPENLGPLGDPVTLDNEPSPTGRA